MFLWESMFSKVSNVQGSLHQLSKAAQEDNYKLLDCQVYNPHLESLGCRDRVQFMDLIRNKD
jgi:leucyl/phenylalanyl-tRNA--protein transferase